jgi:ankyrin repeat protein
MKLLIAAGIDVDGMAYEQSPLSYAALNCSIDAMKLLLDAKADVNSPGHSATRSPLAGALDVMHLEGVKLLIAAGADVTVRDSQNLTLLHRLVSSCLPKGTWTRIGLHDELIPLYAEHLKATPCDPEGVLQALVDAKADISARGPEGITPLQLATVKNNIQAVSALLVAGADPNDAADDGTTALIMAAREGCLGPVAPLLAFGADVNQTDDDGCTALISAVINNCHEIAATLLRSGADVNHFWDDSTALDFWEDGEEDEEMLCLLEDAGALTWDEVVVENNSLLRFSEDGDFLGFEYELVASASEHDKEVALNYAVENDNLSIVKCLLAAGVSPSIRVCSDSLLCMASADGYIDIVRELLDAGADITEKDDEGLTALQVAAKEKHRDVVALLLAHANKLKKANK